MRVPLLLILFIILACKGYAQSCASPIVVDFSSKADTVMTIAGSRNGDCCSGNNCINFTIKVNPNTDLINFNADQITGASFYTVNCGALTPIGTPACIKGLSIIQISFCKPGNNSVNYTVTAIKGSSTSGNLSLRQGCSGAMSVSGFLLGGINWTSIYPGAAGAYNSYLNQTTGANVSVTPPVGAPAYIDYKVTGILSSICSATESDTIRVYTYSPLTASITPISPLICSGTPVLLTATPAGGKAAYTYLWNTGATTQSITASTGGTYTVTVNDQIPGCGAVVKQVTVTAVTPVAPTVAAASTCVGGTATLTATAPGGPYQWYDAATNGTLLSTNSTYTTPVFNSVSTVTYYLQTTNTGCTSTRTPVTVTVNPLPVKPGIASP